MRVRLDDTHVLCSDKYCCWAMKEVQKEDGSGTYELRCTGYHRTLEELILSYIDSEILESEAESLKEIVKKIGQLKKEVKAWTKNVSK